MQNAFTGGPGYELAKPDGPIPRVSLGGCQLLRVVQQYCTVVLYQHTCYRFGNGHAPTVKLRGRLSSMVDVSSIATVSTHRRTSLETSRRELSEDVSFGIGTLLVEQSILEYRPRGV